MNYFPPWGWGPPPPQQNNRNGHGNQQKMIERAVRNALRLRDQPKNDKRKRKEEMSKKAARTRQEFFTSIEIFIIGILAYPIVGPLYNLLVHKLELMNVHP